ncbi:sodium:solute symporter family transporter [Rhodopseudomonas palustris]|uniref:sodium:solute symporter family transporter n=1 Tax=Rhodopseudomonas palustris TaxID=1076 RepID=UPI000D1A626F|nr:hypothetical protein [Rhodopseudomonas palustris]AVT81419.1 hypothetical protein RPYSC3_25580 [Rhodopseudomonas palustris]
MYSGIGTAEVIFAITLIATFGAALLARRHHTGADTEDLAGRQLNRWLIGLSAGTTANSGFIVTAAVGLGYTYGLQWVMLPISWLLGDVIFWSIFPARINEYGHRTEATTLSEVLTATLSGFGTKIVAILSAVIIVICLSGYTAAQWLAGQKFLTGAFGLPEYSALAIFALLIVAYSAIGGFRGSVYTDTLQAFIRIVGTVVAVIAVAWYALLDQQKFLQNISNAGSHFLAPFPNGTIASVVGFVFGFAAAAIGFGLGQPQILTRYLAGKNPQETRAAWAIYIGFVQFTWIAMTVFGILLRGVMPEIADPEAGLSIFFQSKISAVATGIIVADVFATIAATSNGLLIAMSQAIAYDLLPVFIAKRRTNARVGWITILIGLFTMIASTMIHGTVVSLALSSVSLMGAGLAAAVMIRVLDWRHTSLSLLCAIVGGISSAIAWKSLGYGSSFNEAGIGIVVALAVNYSVAAFARPNQKDRKQFSDSNTEKVG